MKTYQIYQFYWYYSSGRYGLLMHRSRNRGIYNMIIAKSNNFIGMIV